MAVDRQGTLVSARDHLDEVHAYLDVVRRALEADMLGASYVILLRHCFMAAEIAHRGVETVLADMRPSGGT